MANPNCAPTLTKCSPLWNDRIHSFINAISKSDTKVGDLPSAFLDTFFPEDSVSSTFSHIITHCEYKDLVDRGVVSKKLKTSGFDKIRQTLGNYCNGNESNDRLHYIERLVEQCNLFYKKNAKVSDVSLQFAVMMIFFSFLHLTVLRERNCYQEELFGYKNPICTKDLTFYLQAYKAYFNTILPQWKDWCKRKIRTTGYDQNLFPENLMVHLSPKLHSRECEKENHITRPFDQIDEEFTKLYEYTSALEQFSPKIHDYPVIVPGSKGPYIFGPYGTKDEELCDDEPGVIAGIDINYSTVVDALKVYYRESTGIREGTQRGNSKNGNLDTIRGLNKEYNHVIAVDLYRDSHVVYGLRFFFSDGKSTQIYGRELGERIRCGSTEENSDLKLTGIRTAGSFYEPLGNIRVIGRIELRFDHIRAVKDNKENLGNVNATVNLDSKKRMEVLGKGTKSRHLM